MTYLDHAGATLYASSQIDKAGEMLKKSVLGNPHSKNPSSLAAHANIEQARAKILSFFNADPALYSVVFTSGLLLFSFSSFRLFFFLWLSLFFFCSFSFAQNISKRNNRRIETGWGMVSLVKIKHIFLLSWEPQLSSWYSTLCCFTWSQTTNIFTSRSSTTSTTTTTITGESI